MAEKKGTALPLRLGRGVIRYKFGTAFVAVDGWTVACLDPTGLAGIL